MGEICSGFGPLAPTNLPGFSPCRASALTIFSPHTSPLRHDRGYFYPCVYHRDLGDLSDDRGPGFHPRSLWCCAAPCPPSPLNDASPPMHAHHSFSQPVAPPTVATPLPHSTRHSRHGLLHPVPRTEKCIIAFTIVSIAYGQLLCRELWCQIFVGKTLP